MGNVIQFVRRPAPETAEPESITLVEIEHVGSVGAVRIVTAYRPGEGETGPYYLVLRAPGVPDWSPISVGIGTGTRDELIETMRGYAQAMGSTLHYARRHQYELAQPDSPPEGAPDAG